mmetsp:Transcript_23416/g.43086  ORF Transcript_23416/g.43086 Transcript_23416/m.43086 type:complete len:208 (+) Transcript_23416:65-688(+)
MKCTNPTAWLSSADTVCSGLRAKSARLSRPELKCRVLLVLLLLSACAHLYPGRVLHRCGLMPQARKLRCCSSLWKLHDVSDSFDMPAGDWEKAGLGVPACPHGVAKRARMRGCCLQCAVCDHCPDVECPAQWNCCCWRFRPAHKFAPLARVQAWCQCYSHGQIETPRCIVDHPGPECCLGSTTCHWSHVVNQECQRGAPSPSHVHRC